MSWKPRLKIMPLLVVVAALSFGVRFGEFVSGVSSAPGAAQAKSAEPAQDKLESPEHAETDSASSETEHKEDTADGTMHEEPANPKDSEYPQEMAKPAERGEKIEWKDSIDSDLEFSTVRMELFEDLSARRKSLAGQERELAVREALLKAAEQEIDQKYKELVSLRSEIQELLVEQSEEEKMRIASLVKIYEGMKPKDAARIFNTLDLDILLRVVSGMSERKSAPIIASMSPDRARTLTMMLMEEKSLPNVSNNFIQ